jgi:putative monooxygenase
VAAAVSAPGETSIAKVRLADVEPNRRRGGELRVVLGPRTCGATSGFMGALTLLPGEHVSEHYHPYSEEFLYVVSGRVDAIVDGERIELDANEGVLVPIGIRHRVENNADTPAFALFHLGPLAPEPSLGHVDTEPLPCPDLPHPEIGAK